tara:strand:+ start:537 stop:803 length:267 start_codon:yes stop_codon:yes gene_type:complete
MWQPARIAKTQSMQLHAVIIHAFCGTIAFGCNFWGYFSCTFSRTDNDGHEIQHTMVQGALFWGKFIQECFNKGTITQETLLSLLLKAW